MVYFLTLYQYDCMVGLLQLFDGHILPYIHVAVEVAARVLGRLCECVNDILRKGNNQSYSKKRTEKAPLRQGSDPLMYRINK